MFIISVMLDLLRSIMRMVIVPINQLFPNYLRNVNSARINQCYTVWERSFGEKIVIFMGAHQYSHAAVFRKDGAFKFSGSFH